MMLFDRRMIRRKKRLPESRFAPWDARGIPPPFLSHSFPQQACPLQLLCETAIIKPGKEAFLKGKRIYVHVLTNR